MELITVINREFVGELQREWSSAAGAQPARQATKATRPVLADRLVVQRRPQRTEQCQRQPCHRPLLRACCGLLLSITLMHLNLARFNAGLNAILSAALALLLYAVAIRLRSYQNVSGQKHDCYASYHSPASCTHGLACFGYCL